MAKIIRADHYRWNVPLKEYKTEGSGFKSITRQSLLGEGEGEEKLNFLTRYFEVQPGGYSSLEAHDHQHTVVIIRGQGEVILQDRVEPISLHDCIYISPNIWHQFHVTGDEPLGFLCIVDRERDRPRLPEKADIEKLAGNPAVKAMLRT